MLKVVAIVDKKGTALDRLAQGVAKYHDNIDYVVCDIHPKRPDPEQLARFEAEAADADIIDAQYYRSLYMLRERYPWLKDKKTILTHNNPYAIEEQEWNDVDINVGNNNYIYKRLGEITEKPVEYIPLTVNTDFWTFNQDWKPNKNVIMVANRIESKKGILPVAIACAELNLHFILVGAISDMSYFQSIMATTGNVEFHEQISDEELRDLYHKSTVHVCNSVDNFESGTLPILEAMLCGVPVLTRSVGHVPDLNNGENMIMLDGESQDVEGIQNKLLDIISRQSLGTTSSDSLYTLRDKGWQTAKSRSFERRAYMYQKLYRQVMHPDQVPVSIVVPVYNNAAAMTRCLNAIANQTYKNIELIISDDAEPEWSENGTLVEDFRQYVSFPVRYLPTGQGNYGLARARNEATIEATGEIMVYCDERIVMEPNAVEEFVKWSKPNVWLYGSKGGKKEFVENFSSIRREDIITAGMFCERITAYGGMSQECRVRFRHQGNRTEFVESAQAVATGKSSNRNRKRQDIIKMKSRLWKMGLEQ